MRYTPRIPLYVSSGSVTNGNADLRRMREEQEGVQTGRETAMMGLRLTRRLWFELESH